MKLQCKIEVEGWISEKKKRKLGFLTGWIQQLLLLSSSS
jgi:hypothetical protein